MTLPLDSLSYQKERNVIYETGKVNGFLKQSIDRIIAKHHRRKQWTDATSLSAPEEDEEQTEALPIIWGRLTFDPGSKQRLFPFTKKHRIRLAHSTHKMKSFLRSPKVSTPSNEKSGVYMIGCNRPCKEKYIRQTKRRIKDRLREHFVC